MRRLIRDISSVLILSGLLLLLDAGVTLVWQEPVTAAIGLIMRGQINQRYLSYRTAPLSRSTRKALVQLAARASGSPTWPAASSARSRPATRSARSRSPRSAPATTSSRAPTRRASRRAPAIIRPPRCPGMGQTVAIAGHRTTYLAPFRYHQRARRRATRSW